MPSSSSSSRSSSSSSASPDPSSLPSSSSLTSERPPPEFDARQNAVIKPLARDMTWVAAPLLLVGVLYGVGMVACLIQAFRDRHFILEAVLIGSAMLFFLALGTWTSKAARAFSDIVTTRGQDMRHL